MKQILQHISVCLLSLLIFYSSVSFNVTVHYCKGNLKEVSFTSSDLNCCGKVVKTESKTCCAKKKKRPIIKAKKKCCDQFSFTKNSSNQDTQESVVIKWLNKTITASTSTPSFELFLSVSTPRYVYVDYYPPDPLEPTQEQLAIFRI